MRRRSASPPPRLSLAAIVAAMLTMTASPVARASQEDCLVEVPGGPKKAPAPRRKAAPTPAPAAKPPVRVAGDAARAPPSPSAPTAASRATGTPAPLPRPRPAVRPKPASADGAAPPARSASTDGRAARPPMPAAKADAASMRKVPIECAPKVMRDVRVRSAVLEEDAPQASAAAPRRSLAQAAGAGPAVQESSLLGGPPGGSGPIAGSGGSTADQVPDDAGVAAPLAAWPPGSLAGFLPPGFAGLHVPPPGPGEGPGPQFGMPGGPVVGGGPVGPGGPGGTPHVDPTWPGGAPPVARVPLTTSAWLVLAGLGALGVVRRSASRRPPA
ncbi:MAG: hypothetical protein O9972_34345 [Burkholderiales bacterium]|nr:hypothetical protein [Burkholderiales bacterium]